MTVTIAGTNMTSAAKTVTMPPDRVVAAKIEPALVAA
jgi:hypothetical protein